MARPGRGKAGRSVPAAAQKTQASGLVGSWRCALSDLGIVARKSLRVNVLENLRGVDGASRIR